MTTYKKARLNKGMTQEALAKAIGVTKGTIARYEDGSVLPSHESLRKLSTVLNVSVDYLVGATETPKKRPVLTENDIKCALFGGGEEDVTDEMWKEVKDFAEYIWKKNQK